MKSIIAALAAIACTVVSAQKITSSRPALNQVLVAGSTAQIVWAPVEGVISTIDLRQGDKNALSFLQTIATNVPANTGTYNWDVPATLPAGTDYAFSFGQSPEESYGPYFTISTGNDSAPAPSNSAPAAGTSVAPKPTGSASTSPAVSKTGAAPSVTPSSAATKNSVAVGAIAVAGAVAAALI